MLDMGKAGNIGTNSKWSCINTALPEWKSASSDSTDWKHVTVEAPLYGGPWEGDLTGWPGYSSIPSYLAQEPLLPEQVEILSGGPNAFSGLPHLLRPGASGITVHLSASAPPASEPALLLDFGRELAGEIQISSEAAAPIHIILSYGESKGEALNGPWQGPQDMQINPGQIGTGRQSAYRFAKVMFTGGPPVFQIRFIRCDMIYYPVHYEGSFNCSDPLLTRIWYVGAYTAHLCMQRDIWDAPKRDRARWMGDLQVSGETINDVFGDHFLMEQTMDSLRADAGSPPHSHINDIPGYSCAWVVGMADFYKHNDDLAYIKRHREDLLQMMNFFKGELDNRGLFADKRGVWCFVDWSPGFDKASPLALAATHFYMVKMLRNGAWLLDQIGDHADAQRCRAWADQAISSAQKYLLDKSTDTFGDRWQENAMAIYSGSTTPSERNAIWDRVFSRLYPVNEQISPYYNYYDIMAMSETGHTHQALDFIRWYWGGMIHEGATTFWENYDPRWPKKHFHKFMGYSASLSHGWSSGPTSFLSERVLGVQPTGGGFSSVLIKPHLASLSWAKGGVPTPNGTLKVNYRFEKSRLRTEIWLPPHEIATVSLPGGRLTVMVNGRPVHAAVRDGRAQVKLVHPGHYTLQ